MNFNTGTAIKANGFRGLQGNRLRNKQARRHQPQDLQSRWDEYFMKIVNTVALKSKDPSSKMGCVIVDRERRPISFGYNGLIRERMKKK